MVGVVTVVIVMVKECILRMQYINKTEGIVVDEGSMENPERWYNPDQPEQTNFCEWGHVQAAIIQTIKQDKLLSNYFTVLKH